MLRFKPRNFQNPNQFSGKNFQKNLFGWKEKHEKNESLNILC